MIELSLPVIAAIALAGLGCGFLNTVASSGSAVSLPVLIMLGFDPITANATNRLPVLVGGMAATAGFHRRGHMPWKITARISVPVVLGTLAGAWLAEVLGQRDLGLVITAAVLLALVLLFTKLRQAILSAATGAIRLGPREFALFVAIGVWLGFIVLDGATYMLLALVLAVRLPLAEANAVKSAVLVPTSLVAVVWFAINGHIVWFAGSMLAAGSIAGSILGAKLACSEAARKWIYRILAFVLLAETVHLALHFLFDTV